MHSIMMHYPNLFNGFHKFSKSSVILVRFLCFFDIRFHPFHSGPIASDENACYQNMLTIESN